jgi:hypothetical protein
MSQSPGFCGNAGLRPLLHGGDERVLREIFYEANVAHDSREAGDELRRSSIRRRKAGHFCYSQLPCLPIDPAAG